MATFETQFLTDLALVIAVAALTTLVFHRLRQPLVLGYLVAGVLVGPHTPGFVVESMESVRALAELGVIFLMFSIGLEFRLSRLLRAGPPALAAALIQILAVLAFTLLLGRLFGWSVTDSLFLGAILAISSSVMAARVIVDTGNQTERWAELALAILIVEDVVAVIILAVLSTGQQAIGAFDVLGVLGRLATFAVLVLVVGLLFLPRLVNHLTRREANETLVVVLASAALMTALLALALGFSPALGAFLVGAVVAEASEAHHAEVRVIALRDLFSAVFFVSIGMLLDPALVLEHWKPIAVLATLLVVFRLLFYSGAAMLFGAAPRDSFRMSMAMSHIGEFSFVIAALGLTLGVVSDFVMPVTIVIAILSAFWTPYLVRAADPVYGRLAPRVPASWASFMRRRRERRLASRAERGSARGRELRRCAGRAVVNAAAALVIVLAGRSAAQVVETSLGAGGPPGAPFVLVPWLVGGVLALPFAMNAARWTERFAARLGRTPRAAALTTGTFAHVFELMVTVAAAVVAWAGLVAIAPFTPPLVVIVVGGVAFVGLAVLMRERVARLHTRIERVLSDAFAGQAQGQDRLAVLDALMENYKPGLEVARVRLKLGTRAVDGTLRDLDMRGRSGAMAVAIQRGQRVIINPPGTHELDPGDVVVLLGKPEQIAAARHLLSETESAEGPTPRVHLAEFRVHAGAPIASQTLAESRLGERMGVTVVGIMRGAEHTFNPAGHTRVEVDDVLVLVGTEDGLESARAEIRGQDVATQNR